MADVSVSRVFLGLREPVLVAAARWLGDRYRLAMGEVVVACPTARAGRRLLELLVERDAPQAGDVGSGGLREGLGLLVPPRIVTPGGLAEWCYRADVSAHATPWRRASEVDVWLAWAQALREATRDDQAALGLEDAASVPRRRIWDAVDELVSAQRELEMHGLTLENGAAVDTSPRWTAAARMAATTDRVLESWGAQRVDRQRLEALRGEGGSVVGMETDLVLVGVSDMTRTTGRLLASAAAAGPGKVTALVAGASDHAAWFGPLGELPEDPQSRADPNVTHGPTPWETSHTSGPFPTPLVSEAALTVVDGPRQLAAAVVHHIARLASLTTASSDAGEGLSLDAVTVGLADETLAASVRRACASIGWPARLATGQPLSQSRPARLLAAASAFVRTGRFDDFAVLLRHPDVPSWAGESPRDRAAQEDHDPPLDVITMLDRYLTEHVQGHVSSVFLGRHADRLAALWKHLTQWLPNDQELNNVGIVERVETWREALAQAYGGVEVAAGSSLGRSLQATAGVLDTLAALGDLSSHALGTLDAAAAAEFILRRLALLDVPEPSGTPAIEVIGWLELPWDNAPVGVLAGVCEETLPGTSSASTLLTASTRRRLGLRDDAYRLTRDRWLLHIVLATRPDTCVIAHRRDARSDPLRPSRLLLDLTGQPLAHRVKRFDLDTPSDPSGDDHRLIHPTDPHPPHTLHRPPIVLPTDPHHAPTANRLDLEALPVTALRDYLASPYRYYLKRVLKLKAVDDRTAELDGGAFGDLAHATLRDWARQPDANTPNVDLLQAQLRASLARLVRQRFGLHPPPAIALQHIQLHARLDAFAHWQAQQWAFGWRIDPARLEQEWSADLIVDHQAVRITARIDRVDHHDTQGSRIIDYKTAESALSPRKTHRRGEQWTDLQLPLYQWMAATQDLTGPIDTGYVLLPGDVKKIGYTSAQWTPAEVQDAVDTAAQVVRDLRACRFETLGEIPAWDDGLAALCGDRLADRDRWAQIPTGATP